MLNTIKDGNIVKIEGILSETDLDYKEFTKEDGTLSKAIGGSIKVRVDITEGGDPHTLEIPVYMFASEWTKAGKPNPAYEAIRSIKEEYTSIASYDIDHADRIRITRGQIKMNEYYAPNGNLVSTPRINASFVSKIKKEECHPKAEFLTTFMVGKTGYMVDRDGVETDKYQIMGMVPQYGGQVDVVPFVVTNPGVIDAVSNYWTEGDTVRAAGRLNFTAETREVQSKVDFGEPVVERRTFTISELVITGGSATPLDGDFAINYDDVKVALEGRKERLAKLKDKQQEKGTSGKAPAPTAGRKFADLGF